MMYYEFLRLSGATDKECSIDSYYKYIEPAYMGNDFLFPSKDAVIEHWRRFGVLGFTRQYLALMMDTYKVIQRLNKYHIQPKDGMAEFVNFLLNAASNNGRKE